MEHEQGVGLAPGQAVVWTHVPRGGYSYPHRVPAEVVRVTTARVVIRVQMWNGEWVQRAVRPSSLRARGED